MVSLILLSAKRSCESITQYVPARRLLDMTALLQIVHPLLVHQESLVRTSAGLDLARDNGARSEGESDGHPIEL